MRYSLWSHGRLLGHTDLDIPCVTSHLKQGFIEPTPAGNRILPNATGVPKAAFAFGRPNLPKAEKQAKMAEFMAACERREALELEIRDEAGELFEFDFIRIYDLRDEAWLDEEISHVEDGMPDHELDPELEAAVKADAEAWIEEHEDKWGSAWPPRPPEDLRWTTMRYQIQVFLERRDDAMFLEIDDLFSSD